MNTLRKLLTMQGLRVVLLLLVSGLLTGVSFLPSVPRSDSVPRGSFSLGEIEEWAPMPNRTMIVRVGGFDYLFQIEKMNMAGDCRGVQVEQDKLVWLTHIGYMPYKYFTSTTPISVRKTGDITWDSFVGRTWVHQCEEADCGKKKEEP